MENEEKVECSKCGDDECSECITQCEGCGEYFCDFCIDEVHIGCTTNYFK